jgi:predicted RNA binding protein with dsRBD fold (UPF0201 family)
LPDEPHSARVRLVATISPSESPQKVLLAAKNVVGECACEIDESANEVRLISNDVRSLQLVHDQLRDRRIRDAARRFLLKTREGNSLLLLLNRQAAYVGTVAICSTPEESPLGPIFLRISSDEADAVIDWLTAH